MTQYDLIIIGAGAAGSTCAERVNEAGKQVALIERDALGGTCLNYGCDPTKAALHLGKIWHDARKLPSFEGKTSDNPEEWFWFQERIQAVQEKMRGGSKAEARQQMRERGIELILGQAAFLSPHEIEVNGRALYGKHILIATGSEPEIPEIPGLEDSGFVTYKNILNLPLQPEHLAVIGGGPVGVEFAQLFARLGTQVTLIEAAGQILSEEDPELAAELEAILSEEGINLHTQAELTNVAPLTGGHRLTVTYDNKYEEQLDVSHLLIAGGRTPSLSDLNVNEAGIHVENNQLVTEPSLRTNVPHIWAAGDVIAEFPFTHVAWRQGEHVAQNIVEGQAQPFDMSHVPWVTYTDPELAHVGQTEAQLEEAGRSYQVINQSMSKVARSIVTNQTDGRVKLIVDDKYHILGGHVLAPSGGELLGPILMAMKEKIPATMLSNLVWPYPTLSTVWGKIATKLAQ